MPLDPQVQAMLAELEALSHPPLHTLDAPAARKVPRITPAMAGPLEPIAHIADETIPGPGGALPVRIYTPAGSGPFPLLVYFRGGGWTIGDLNYRDGFCRTLATGADCVVVSVDYRNAPEHKFPAAVEDAYAATGWVAAHAAALNGDPAQIVVGGDSAGGNLAAVTALRVRDEDGPPLNGQALIYPITDYYEPGTPSYRENAEGYFLTRDLMIWFWHNYLSSAAEAGNPLAAPLRATDLRNLPPALVITAEYDPLRDEGERYAARLREAGVPTELIRYNGLIHGFIGMTGGSEACKQAAAEIVMGVRRMFEVIH